MNKKPGVSGIGFIKILKAVYKQLFAVPKG